jgi:hypothetical protein
MTDNDGTRDAGVRLLRDLEAFFLEHRWCGEVASEVTTARPGRVFVKCSCGARLARAVPEDSS